MRKSEIFNYLSATTLAVALAITHSSATAQEFGNSEKQNTNSSQGTKNTNTKDNTKDKKALTTTSQKPSNEESLSLLTYTAAYQLRTDLAEPVEPRTHYNLALFSVSMNTYWDLVVDVSGGVQFASANNEINTQDDGSNGVDWTDPQISIAKRFYLDGFRLIPRAQLKSDKTGQTLSRDSLTVYGSYTFSAAEDTRYEGIKGAPSAGVSLSNPFFSGIWTLRNSLEFMKILNTYAESPTSRFGSNPDNFASYSLVNIFKLPAQFYLSASVGARFVRYLDGLQDVSTHNSLGITYVHKGFSTSLSYLNGSYPDTSDVDLWFYDKYRQIVSLTLRYVF